MSGGGLQKGFVLKRLNTSKMLIMRESLPSLCKYQNIYNIYLEKSNAVSDCSSIICAESVEEADKISFIHTDRWILLLYSSKILLVIFGKSKINLHCISWIY